MIDVLKYYGLDGNPDLEAIGFESEEDWHRLRTKGIGGSDIGAIMGINKYSSPLQIYKSKVEGYVKDLSDKVVVRKGKDLESLIRTLYVAPHFAEQDYTVINMSHHMIINKKAPIFRANLDGIAKSNKPGASYEDNIVIEIKFVSTFAEDNWNKDEYQGVPASYYAQVQEYMYVTGIKKACVCALFESTWTVGYYEIPRDITFISKLVSAGTDFYNNHMLAKIPPKYVSKIDSEDIMKKLDEEAPKPMIADASLNETVVEYMNLYHEIKDKEKELDKQKDILVNAFLEGRVPVGAAHTVKVSKVKSSRLDTKKLEEEKPDIYKQYLKETESIRTTIK